MKHFLTKLEWFEPKINNNKYGLALWRLGDLGGALSLVAGSKLDEDFILNPDLTDDDFKEIACMHIKDYAARLRKIGFTEKTYHGRKITRSGAIGAATVLGLSPVDFWYMAHIDKRDPGEEFWRAVEYFNDTEIDFP